MALTLKLDDIKPLLGAVGLDQPSDPGADSAVRPPIPQGPPPPLPPTPAAAGFSAWAADPKNAQKVADGVTPPGSPLLPPPPTPPLGANVPLDPNAAQMASVNPPKPPTPAFLTPPTMAADMAANPGQYQHPNFAKGRGVIGNGLTLLSAGLAGAAGGLGNKNPMAGLEYVQKLRDEDAAIPAANAAQYDIRNVKPLRDAVAARQASANLAHTAAETADIGNKSQLQLARYGLKTETDPTTGITSTVPDTDSPVYKANQDKDTKLQHQTELIGAQIDNTKAQKELRDATAAFTNAKSDPNSPLFQQTQARLKVAQQNAAAAQTRATAYMGNYLKGAYNIGNNGQTLPGAPIIADDNGNQTVVGATNAPLAAKNQSNAAQFNDVHGALDSLEGAADALVNKGGKLNSPGVAAALSQPAGTLGQWLQGAGVKANLTPEERNYVTAIAAAHENVQALRKSAGGTATDSAVSKLDALIPGVSTPDIDYLKRQTGQIRSTAERLGKGATTASGGLSVRGQQKGGITPPPTGAASPTETLPPQASSQLQEGVQHTFNNGQTWTLQAGKPVRIK